MVTRQQSFIDRGLLTIVDRGKTVVGVAPTSDVKEVTGGQPAAEKAEDTARLSQKAAAQAIRDPAAGMLTPGVFLTPSAFSASFERQKQTKLAPPIEAQASVLDRLLGFFGTAQRITDPGFFVPRLLRGGARAGAAVGFLRAGVPPQQLSPFVLGTESAVAEAVAGGVQAVIGPQGLIGPGGLIGPPGAPGLPGLSGIAGAAREQIIRVVLPDQPAAGGLGLTNKVLIGLALVLGIVFLGKK